MKSEEIREEFKRLDKEYKECLKSDNCLAEIVDELKAECIELMWVLEE